MNKLAYKISSIAYFLIFIVCLILQFNTASGEKFIGFALLALIISPSIVSGIFGFLDVDITPSSRAHLYMTWVATGILLLMGIWAALSGECTGEGGMGCAIFFILGALLFGIAQLVGLASLIGAGINYLKK